MTYAFHQRQLGTGNQTFQLDAVLRRAGVVIFTSEQVQRAAAGIDLADLLP